MKERITQSHRKGLTLIEEYGIENAKKIIEKLKKPRPSMIGEKNPSKREDVKERIRLKAFGRKLDVVTKEKLSNLKRGDKNPMFGKHHTIEAIKKMKMSKLGKPNIKWKGKHHAESTKEKIRQMRMKQRLPNKFTKPEMKFMRIIRKHNLPYKYTGNGSFWIENINPDFVQTNGKKICIEIWGDYWHNLPKEIKKDEKKLEILQKYGWHRIVIWEHELLNVTQPIVALETTVTSPHSLKVGR